MCFVIEEDTVMKSRVVNLLASLIIIMDVEVSGVLYRQRNDKDYIGTATSEGNSNALEQFCNCWFWEYAIQKEKRTEIGLKFVKCIDPRKPNLRESLQSNMTFSVVLFLNSSDEPVGEKSFECDIKQNECVRRVPLKIVPNVDYSLEVSPYCGSLCYACAPLVMDYYVPAVDKNTRVTVATTKAPPQSHPDTTLPILIIAVVFVIIVSSAVILAIHKYRYTMRQRGSHPPATVQVILNNEHTVSRENDKLIGYNKIFVATQPLFSANTAEDNKILKLIEFLESFTELKINYLNSLDLNILETISANIHTCDTVILVPTTKLVWLCCDQPTDNAESERLHGKEMRYLLQQIQFHNLYTLNKTLYIVNLEDSDDHIHTLMKNELLDWIQVMFRIKEITDSDEQLEKLVKCLLSKDRHSVTTIDH